MKLNEGSIGSVCFGKEWKWYIIVNGKAKYITESRWYELMDLKHEINQPLYSE